MKEATHPEVSTLVSARCPIKTTLDMLGGKWKLVIIHLLSEAPMRFKHLKENLPDISDKVLTQELGRLSEDQLIERTVRDDSNTPIYSLTEIGTKALPLIEFMSDFGTKYEEHLAG